VIKLAYVNRGSLTYQIQQALMDKLSTGESKHLAKKMGTHTKKIYSYETLRGYMKHANYFAKWAKAEYGCKTLDECRPHINEYLQSRMDSGLSPHTIKLDTSALAKLYSVSAKDFDITTPPRTRSGITRSRGITTRDKHFSEKRNSDLVNFCKSTGLRRAELENLKGDRLFFKNNKPYIRVDTATKGGKVRDVPVIGTPERVQDVIKKMQEAGEEKVFGKAHNAADIHGYRREYAQSLYNSLARDIKDIPFDRINKGTGRAYQSEVYNCRDDKKGIQYDKAAMREVSAALGHTRISVIGGNYLD